MERKQYSITLCNSGSIKPDIELSWVYWRQPNLNIHHFNSDAKLLIT